MVFRVFMQTNAYCCGHTYYSVYSGYYLVLFRDIYNYVLAPLTLLSQLNFFVMLGLRRRQKANLRAWTHLHSLILKNPHRLNLYFRKLKQVLRLFLLSVYHFLNKIHLEYAPGKWCTVIQGDQGRASKWLPSQMFLY